MRVERILAPDSGRDSGAIGGAGAVWTGGAGAVWTGGAPAPADAGQRPAARDADVPVATGLGVQQLSVGYPGGIGRGRRQARVVLSGLDLVAVPGRVTMLLGANGAGKSTLLRTIACLQPALAGRVEVDGADLGRLSARARARTLAVVLTERFDPGLLTGGEVVALGRHPHVGPAGALSSADREAVGEALAMMHAEDLADHRLAEMSDGQRQRIMVARALAQEPRLLVLDEPSAFLDAPARIELLARLAVVAVDRGIAVLLSTHDVETALRAGGDAWLIGRPGAASHGGAINGAAALLGAAPSPKCQDGTEPSSAAPGAAVSGSTGRGGRAQDATAQRAVPGRTPVISGPIELLAASGAINDAFDSVAVGFDAASGTFRLR